MSATPPSPSHPAPAARYFSNQPTGWVMVFVDGSFTAYTYASHAEACARWGLSIAYVSPVPAEVRLDYRRRVGGNPSKRRVHVWGADVICEPDGCRECYRERHWLLGQTHGR